MTVTATIADVLEGRARWCVVEGDCLPVLAALPAGSISACVTDPPYGVSLGQHATASADPSTHLVKGGYESFDDSHESFCTEVVPRLTEAIRISTRAAVFAAGFRAWDLPRANAVGAVYLPSGMGRTPWGFNNLSHVLFYGSGAEMHRGCRPTVIPSTETAEPNGHPVPKPIGWMLWLVRLSSSFGEVVLDPFAGSGTTGVAAVRLGRRAILIEREPKYAAICRERMVAEESGSTLQAARAGQEPLFGAGQ